MKDELTTLKLKVEKARASVKRMKASLKAAKGDKQIAMRTRVLRAAKTRLATAEAAYAEAKPKNTFQKKAEKVTENVKDRYEKTNFKKYATWTGLAITTTATAIIGFLLYDYMNKEDEEGAQPDTV